MPSLVAAVCFVTLAFDLILKEIGLIVNSQGILNTAPSSQHFINAVNDVATEVFVITRQKTHKGIAFALIHTANRNRLHYIVKVYST